MKGEVKTKEERGGYVGILIHPVLVAALTLVTICICVVVAAWLSQWAALGFVMGIKLYHREVTLTTHFLGSAVLLTGCLTPMFVFLMPLVKLDEAIGHDDNVVAEALGYSTLFCLFVYSVYDSARSFLFAKLTQLFGHCS